MDEAVDGSEALAMFSGAPEGYYHTILMDIQMPKMDGYEATRAIRALSRPDATAVPIIAVSANAFREDIEKAEAAGMNLHLSKPVDPAVLIDMLHKYLK